MTHHRRTGGRPNKQRAFCSLQYTIHHHPNWVCTRFLKEMRVEGECKCCCAHPSRRGGVRVVPRAGDVHHRRQDAPQRSPTTRRACEAHTVAMRGRWRGADPGRWLVPRPGAVSFPDHDLPLAEAERRCSAPIYTHQRNLHLTHTSIPNRYGCWWV